MRALILMLLMGSAHAEMVIRQMYPGGMERTDTPNFVIQDDGLIYQTTPGTTLQDFRGEEYRIIKQDRYSDPELIPTYPGTGMRRYDRPSYQLDDGRAINLD